MPTRSQPHRNNTSKRGAPCMCTLHIYFFRRRREAQTRTFDPGLYYCRLLYFKGYTSTRSPRYLVMYSPGQFAFSHMGDGGEDVPLISDLPDEVQVVIYRNLSSATLGKLGSVSVAMSKWISGTGAACLWSCLLYTSPSPRDYAASRMPSSA